MLAMPERLGLAVKKKKNVQRSQPIAQVLIGSFWFYVLDNTNHTALQ
jgi:hypothetical protein